MIDQIDFENQIKSYQQDQAKCVELIHIAHRLWLEKSVDLFLFGTAIRDKSGATVLKVHHQQSAQRPGGAIPPEETLKLAKLLRHTEVPAGPLDIGKLALRLSQNPFGNNGTADLIRALPTTALPDSKPVTQDVVLYGFGRIGRLLARTLINGMAIGSPLRLRAIVTRDILHEETLEKRANLLRNDSIHGPFDADIRTDITRERLIINGIPIQMISARGPEVINYLNYGIQDALVIDNTGYLRDEIQLSRHFSSPGTLSVLLTAPGKGMPNIIMGVNDAELKSISEGSLISAASCTTNAIAPVLAVIQQHLHILKGHVETIHAYTNDQNLVDNMHRKARRDRAAALNMVITETGAGTAMAKVFPNLKGKLTSNAIRVPLPDGSLAILHLELAEPIDRADLNNLFQQAAAEGNLSKQIYFSGAQELVSSDIIGTSAASIVDGLATQVSNDGRTAILYIWYDNEYGYSHQVIRLAEKMVSITHQA